MIKKILKILDQKHKYYCLILLLIFLPVTFIETIGISSIPAFVLIITQPDELGSYISNLEITNLILNLSLQERAVYGSMIIGVIFVVKSIVVLLVSYFEAYIIRIINVNNSAKLYQIYLNNNYYFHIENDPPKLIQNISDVSRSTSIIFSFLTLIKESFLILIIIFLLFLSDPKIFTITFIILSIPIFFYNFFFRKKLRERGLVARKFRIMALKDITQGLGGIKFSKLLNQENFLTTVYKKNLNTAAIHDMFLAFLSKTPKIFLELLSITSILILIVLFTTQGKNFNEFLPVLTFIVVATVRLIPSFGNIISSLNNIKFNSISLENVYSSLSDKKIDTENTIQDYEKLPNNDKGEFLELNSVDFNYPNKNENIIDDLSLSISKNKIVGITGASGSGKTTLIDLILGLLTPNGGQIKSFGKDIRKFLKSWRKNVGYVPQNVNLIDDSIKNNICFGHLHESIDSDLLRKCVNFSELDLFIKTLPGNIETNIGHLGKKISGGQLQRIGIARALYQNPDLLIFDEATNALDIEIEDRIIENLKNFKKDITVILISHRLSVLKKCDKIFLLDKGKIKFEGPFQNLPNLRKKDEEAYD